MSQSLVRGLAAVLAVAAAACTQQNSGAMDYGAEAGIASGDAVFTAGVAAGDAAAIASVYAADATVMPPNGASVTGPADIEALMQTLLDQGTTGVTLNSTEILGTGTTVTALGTYTLAGADGATIDRGKYMAVWNLIDGKWKIYRDIWNSDLPIEGSENSE